MRETISTILKYLKPHRKKVYFLVFLSVITAVIASTVPLVYGWVFDSAVNGKPLTLIGIGLLSWVALSLVKGWFNRIVDRHSTLVSVKSAVVMLADYADQFLHLPVSYLKEKKIGRMVNGFDRASDRLEMIVNQVMFNLMPDLLTIIFILIILIGIHWSLFLFLFIILFFFVAITIKKAKNIIKIDKKLNKSYHLAFGDYFEYLSNYQTVKAFSAEDKSMRRIRFKLQGIEKGAWDSTSAWNNMSAWQNTTVTIGFVGLFGLGILMMRTGVVSPGNLVSFVGFVGIIFGSLFRLGMYYKMLNRAIAEIGEANKIYNVKTESELRYKNQKEIKDVAGAVSFDKVSFRYKGKKQPLVIDEMSFSVKPGEVIALVGGSGAGKSTMIDLISGYYLPTKGKVSIDGNNTRMIDAKSLRQYIALVPQEVSLFHETIEFNIGYGLSGVASEQIKKIAKAANAHEFIMEFPRGYKSKVGERGVKLSGGQKQRLAIARALIRDPRILILDEATSSLDSITENLVQEALERLVKGRTTFIIAHRLSTVTHADRIFVLEGGKIVEMGSHEELIAKGGAYKKLYDAQQF